MNPPTSLSYSAICDNILKLSRNDQQKLLFFLKGLCKDSGDNDGKRGKKQTPYQKGQEIAFVFEGKLRSGRVEKIYTNHLLATCDKNRAYLLCIEGNEKSQIVITSTGK